MNRTATFLVMITVAACGKGESKSAASDMASKNEAAALQPTQVLDIKAIQPGKPTAQSPNQDDSSPVKILSAKRTRSYETFNGSTLTPSRDGDTVVVLELGGISPEEFNTASKTGVYVLVGTEQRKPNTMSSGVINGEVKIVLGVVVPTATTGMVLHVGHYLPRRLIVEELSSEARATVPPLTQPDARDGSVEGGEIGGGIGNAPPSVPPQIVPPSALEGSRIAGDKNITPSDTTKTEIQRSGKGKIVGSYKLCVTVDGTVRSVEQLKSTGFGAYDSKIQSEMRDWRYRPYMVNGRPVPVCTAVTFIYSQR